MKLGLSFLRHVSGKVGAANAFKQVLFFCSKLHTNKKFTLFIAHWCKAEQSCVQTYDFNCGIIV